MKYTYTFLKNTEGIRNLKVFVNKSYKVAEHNSLTDWINTHIEIKFADRCHQEKIVEYLREKYFKEHDDVLGHKFSKELIVNGIVTDCIEVKRVCKEHSHNEINDLIETNGNYIGLDKPCTCSELLAYFKNPESNPDFTKFTNDYLSKIDEIEKNVDSTPARVGHKSGIIEVNKEDFMKPLTPEQRILLNFPSEKMSSEGNAYTHPTCDNKKRVESECTYPECDCLTYTNRENDRVGFQEGVYGFKTSIHHAQSIGCCSKHKGQSMINCPMCAAEKYEQNTIEFEKMLKSNKTDKRFTLENLQKAVIMAVSTYRDGGKSLHDILSKLQSEEYIQELMDAQKTDTDTKDYIVKKDMICPVTEKHCDDECCPEGSICNMKPNSNGLISDVSPIEEETKLKLFVWEDVLHDRKSGIAFAYAKDSVQARILVIEKLGYNQEDLCAEPREIKSDEAFYIYG